METIVTIQALRAAAALAVAAVHFNQIWSWLAGRNDAPLVLYSLASGVDLFFVISGFVMVYSSEALYGQAGAPRQFIVSRLARIVLPYWLATLIAIPLMELPFTWDQLVKSLLFIPYSNATGSVVPLFGIGWTLNFEMFFYLLFALALFGPRWSVVAGVLAVLTAMVTTNVLGMLAPPWFRFLSDPIVLEFGFGMLVAIAYRRRVTLPVWLRVLMVAGGAVAVWFSAASMPPSHWRVILWGLPAAIVLAGAVLGPPPPASRLTWLATTLGDASYSIYLLHGLFGAALMRLRAFPVTHKIPLQLEVAGTFVAMLLLSIASYKLLERPATAAIKRLLASRRPPSRKRHTAP